MEQKRSDRLASVIHQNIGMILLEVTGSLGIHPVSVTRVEVKPDVSWAVVYLSFFNQEKEKKDFPKLVKNLYDIQGELNRKLTTKKLPRLKLVVDQGIKYAAHIDEILNNFNDSSPNS